MHVAEIVQAASGGDAIGDLAPAGQAFLEFLLRSNVIAAIASGNGKSVEGDRDLLSLALRQLLDNAIKYSPPTSVIEVTANGNGIVEISVRNSGSAIPEREQARIFERFYRGAQARHVPGTGMGLAIVQQIMRAHNGHLQVTSAPEHGTAFTLSLPHGRLSR